MRRTAGVLLLLLAALGLGIIAVPAPSQASWLEPHTRQEPFPHAEIERALVVGKSWTVASLDFSWKHSNSHFIGDSLFNLGATEGVHFNYENNDGTWDYRRWEFAFTWGFSRNLQLDFHIPIVWASVWNNRMMDGDTKTPIEGVGLGDLRGGFLFQWLRTEKPKFNNSLATNLTFRFPTGSESPGTYLGGPNNVPTVITGSGTWGFDVGLRFKQQVAIVAIEAAVGYTWNPVGVVMYLIEDEEDFFNQHLDPGDVIHGNLGVTVQFFDKLALRGDLFLDYRTSTRWGSTTDSFPACETCLKIPASNGFWMDVEGRLIIDPTIRLGIDAYFRYSLAGRHSFLWPIEELSPSRGWTAGTNISYRF
ncbi:MAG: hypothetical protein CMP23_17330 [Rickettsiales bacterium]|nr:hypothetical protein [Rickettsiales bacterium]